MSKTQVEEARPSRRPQLVPRMIYEKDGEISEQCREYCREMHIRNALEDSQEKANRTTKNRCCGDGQEDREWSRKVIYAPPLYDQNKMTSIIHFMGGTLGCYPSHPLFGPYKWKL